MALAGMIALDEDALICDFAETYQIYEYRALPVKLCATLAAGLRDTSRIKTKIGGLNATIDIILLAHIIDSVNTLVWFQTEDGHKNKNRPESILEKIMADPEEEPEFMSFDTPEEFELARQMILTGKGG